MTQETKKPIFKEEIVRVINGKRITMRFSKTPRPDVYLAIRQMLLSSSQEKRICTFAEKENL